MSREHQASRRNLHILKNFKKVTTIFIKRTVAGLFMMIKMRVTESEKQQNSLNINTRKEVYFTTIEFHVKLKLIRYSVPELK